MLLLVGLVVLALGLFSGAALVLASFGIGALQAGYVLWALFPVLCLVGFGLVAGNADARLLRTLSLAASGLLLVLALASLAGLVLGSAGVVAAPQESMALWYVLLVGMALGGLGAASFKRTAPAQP